MLPKIPPWMAPCAAGLALVLILWTAGTDAAGADPTVGAPAKKADVSTSGNTPQFLTLAEMQKLQSTRNLAAPPPSVIDVRLPAPPKVQVPDGVATPRLLPAAELQRVQAAKLEAYHKACLAAMRRPAGPKLPPAPMGPPEPVKERPGKEAPR